VAGSFEDYLSTNNNPAPIHQNYGLLQTKPGTELAREHAKKAGGYLRLGAVNLLVSSTHTLVKSATLEGEGKEQVATDKTLAHRVLDRLTAATNIVSEDGINISGKATKATNQSYLNLVFYKAVTLVERLAVIKDPNVIHLLRREFNYDRTAKEIKAEKDFEAQPLQKLRFQLHVLTYVFLNALAGERGAPVQQTFTYLKGFYSGFDNTLERLSRLASKHMQAYTKRFTPISANIAAVFRADPLQGYFEIDKDGNVRSLPRPFLFTTNTEKKEDPINQRPTDVILQVAQKDNFLAGSTLEPQQGVEILSKAGFILQKPEELHSFFVASAILKPVETVESGSSGKGAIKAAETVGKAVLSAITQYASKIRLPITGEARGSALTSVFYQLQPRKENKEDEVDKNDDAGPDLSASIVLVEAASLSSANGEGNGGAAMDVAGLGLPLTPSALSTPVKGEKAQQKITSPTSPSSPWGLGWILSLVASPTKSPTNPDSPIS